MRLIELAQLLEASGTFVDAEVTGFGMDTRTLKPGDVFVALRADGGTSGFVSGAASKSGGDGHAFVAAAEKAGAIAAIVDHAVEGVSIPQLVVKDTLMDGLWKVAAAVRSAYAGKVIGVTGSAGKSTTKEMLAVLLDAYANPGSFNNFWGVPYVLANLPVKARFTVAEMGMNVPGEMHRLSELVKPDVALVLNVKPVHVQGVGSVDGIRREKLSIADGLREGGALVVPHDLDLSGCAWKGRVVTFSMLQDGDADVRLKGYEPHGTIWDCQAFVAGRVVRFAISDGAEHRLYNALAALACAYAAHGFDSAQVAEGARRLESAGVLKGRGVAETVNGVTVIDDSFNANPASVAAALSALKARPVAGRRFALLGDMLELGDDSVRFHEELAPLMVGVDGVYCVGELMGSLYDILPIEKRLGWQVDPLKVDVAEVKKHLKEGDAVVVKGSKKMLWNQDVANRLKEALRGN